MKKLQDKFQNAVAELQNNFIERDELSIILVAGTLARFNTFLLGSAGVAKSQMIRYLGSMFSDAYVFDRPCHPTQSISDVVGPLKLSELQKGNDVYERKLTRYLAQADIAFLDEVGRSAGPVRDAILSIMNERIYWNGDTLVDTPLQCLFSGSNHLLMDGRDDAFMDRFLYRYLVADQIKEEHNFKRLLRKPKFGKPSVQISLSELKEAQGCVSSMGENYGEATEAALVAARDALLDHGFSASPRTWANIPTALAAFAYLEGDVELLPRHLEWLADAIWKKPEERNSVLFVVGNVSNPALAEAVRKLDRLKSEVSRIPEDVSTPNWIGIVSKVNSTAKSVVRDLETAMLDPNANTPRMGELLSEAQRLKKSVTSKCEAALGVKSV